jgi:hypothetical protein
MGDALPGIEKILKGASKKTVSVASARLGK